MGLLRIGERSDTANRCSDVTTVGDFGLKCPYEPQLSLHRFYVKPLAGRAGAHSENRQLGDAAIFRERRLFASGLHLLVGLWMRFIRPTDSSASKRCVRQR